jgi:hypothetical protein
VSENRVLRRIFGPKEEEVVGDWRRLHNEALHNLYTSPNTVRVIKSKRMRCVGQVACMEEMKNAYNIFEGKAEGKRPLGRPRRKRQDNIRMDIKEIDWKGVDRIYLAQDRD